MKTTKEILVYYGKCCVKEYELLRNNKYPAGKEGEMLVGANKLAIAHLTGKKLAIEFILCDEEG